MRILLIRHGDPDYENDALTPKGIKEAELLSERLIKEKIDYAYVSTMGRAMMTAKPTLDKKSMEAVYCDWLREFSATKIKRPDLGGKDAPVCWDWLPQDWTKYEEFYRYDEWYNQDIMAEVDMKAYSDYVTSEFDSMLSKHGYVHDGHIFRVKKANDDTIALFCHFGLGCVLLGHLLGISPMALWHGYAAPPTSVTTIMTEERREGIASFRVWGYGDISHLYVADEMPSFSARFCEMYSNEEERHD